MTAATRPALTCGIATPRTISQRVEPSASEPALRSLGTLSKSSRLMLATIGTIMIVSTRQAGSRPTFDGVPQKSGMKPKWSLRNGSTCGLEERAHDQDPPQAEDDARDRGQQLDQRPDRRPQPPRRELAQEEADRDRDRHGQDEREERGHRGAPDQVERAELVR